MKKLLYISLLAVLLSAAISCSRSVDKRLVLADTLMWTNPDSSLAILNSVNRDSLQGEENLAYYALLLTQARFRVDYYDYPSDSLINTALDYFSDNHNREHYTRSLLYKGAFYEVHDQPVEAIKYYKQAEDNADTTDYHNLAQINMRIGMLYNKCFITTGEDISKFKKALYYYRKLHHRDSELLCLLYIGEKLRVSNDSKTVDYLQHAKELAIDMKDTISIVNAMQLLCRYYLYDSCYVEAHQIAQSCITSYPKHMTEDIILDEARAYAKLGKVDMAEIYMDLIENPVDYDVSKVYSFYTLADIALAKGDNSQYIKNKRIADSLCDIAQIKRDRLKLPQVESTFNEQKIQQANSKKEVFRIAVFLLIAFIVALIVFGGYHYKKRKDQQQMIDELKEENFGNYEELRSNLADFDNHFSKTMNERLKSLEEIMTGAYNPNQDSKSSEVEHKISPIADDDTKFWEGLYSYIKHNGAMDKIANDFPQLSASDLNFIKLMCCGFSDAAIAVCRNYRNVASVRSRRRKIRDKMGIKGNLTDYIINITQGLEPNNYLQH